MNEIKCIAKQIRSEMCDAEAYAKKYLEYRDTDRELASTYRAMCEQEINHANMLHDQAVRLIRDFKNRGETVPETMKIIWDWEHEGMIDKNAYIQNLLTMK